MKRVWQEALLVGVAGGALAFAANAFSPRGLKLDTNYFPAVHDPLSAAATAPASATNGALPILALAERFKKEGLQLADRDQVLQLFHDPRRQQDQVVFIDARNDEEYQAGHIPGAYQFVIFHAENYLPALSPLCQNAAQIVFYCGGGDCDLSENAAIYLRDGMSLPREKVFVYGGGFTEWRNSGLPVETGGRNSGNLTNPTARQPE